MDFEKDHTSSTEEEFDHNEDVYENIFRENCNRWMDTNAKLLFELECRRFLQKKQQAAYRLKRSKETLLEEKMKNITYNVGEKHHL